MSLMHTFEFFNVGTTFSHLIHSSLMILTNYKVVDNFHFDLRIFQDNSWLIAKIDKQQSTLLFPNYAVKLNITMRLSLRTSP